MKATDGRPHDHWLRRLGALVCLAGLGLNAQAASTVTLSEKLTGWSPNPGGGWVRNAYNPRSIDAANATRSWLAAGEGASARIIATDASIIAGRAGALPVTTAMSVGIGDAAGAVARCLLGGTVVCAAAGAAAAVAYGAYRVYAAPDGGLMADPGQAPSGGTAPGYRASWSGFELNVPAASGPGAAQALMDQVNALYHENCHILDYPGGSTFRGVCDSGIIAPGSWRQEGTVTVSANCAATIDPLNPAYSTLAGPPGPDGQCPVGRYNAVPITPADAAAKVAAHPPADPTPWVQATKDAIDTGGQSAPAGITTTGPASQTGTPTTTTTTGGSPAETITETKTPTYTYNYAGDTITYNTSITNVTNNITTGTTTTTTTNTPAATPQDPTDPCTANPDRIGCLKLGETPTDVVPTKSPNITFSAESVGLPSACPADQVIAGKAYSFGPICDAATNARPWVIVGAIFSALMLMLAGVRQI